MIKPFKNILLLSIIIINAVAKAGDLPTDKKAISDCADLKLLLIKNHRTLFKYGGREY